ncbi:7696_t:CDS:2, partial [Entrophospora sp. SA101]
MADHHPESNGIHIEAHQQQIIPQQHQQQQIIPQAQQHVNGISTVPQHHNNESYASNPYITPQNEVLDHSKHDREIVIEVSPNDVFDVYVTRNRERVWLIDFNPFGSMTDSILYSWEEILSETLSSLTLFRIVTSQIEASQFHNQNFSVNRYPREVIDFSQGQTVIEFAERFQREL